MRKGRRQKHWCWSLIMVSSLSLTVISPLWFILFGSWGEGKYIVSRYSKQHMIVLVILDTILPDIFGSVDTIEKDLWDTKPRRGKYTWNRCRGCNISAILLVIWRWFGRGGAVSPTSSMMGCERRLNGAAGPFHSGYFFGISIVMMSNMSDAQKVVANRSDGMPILIRGPTTWQRLMFVIIRSTLWCGLPQMRIPQSQKRSLAC